MELQKKYPDVAKEVEFHEYFKTFDGSTGFDLPTHFDWVAPLWERLKAYEQKKNDR